VSPRSFIFADIKERRDTVKAIETKNLCKTYRARVKAEGLSASFRALVKPEWREIQAVRGVSLQVEEGEIMAFIGPNGAGKSTFIKMLCGILYPSAGEISVLGLSPARDRRKLSMRIGTVFGQKSQLWLHLPALDSFTLLAAIYEIDDAERKRRVAELSELFDLGDFLHTPVRKLSLGQRIRCEIAASLLHNPEMLFLDEPTIGLDVVVKQAIRELIARRNRENGTTVFLTSHDPADIEQLCRRAVVIDHGGIVLDSPVETLRSDYLGRKLIDVRFGTPQELPELGGVTVVTERGGLHGTLTVDTGIRPIGDVMERLSVMGNVLDITISNPPMEDIIAAIFQQEAAK
jgi:ABC-2 type transport system ATP-binding protein